MNLAGPDSNALSYEVQAVVLVNVQTSRSGSKSVFAFFFPIKSFHLNFHRLYFPESFHCFTVIKVVEESTQQMQRGSTIKPLFFELRNLDYSINNQTH